MGLAESQKLLARLYTDAKLRARFASDPASVAAEFGLDHAASHSLAALPLGSVDEFARSLIRKRRGEVESLLPLTVRALGSDRFASMFRRHALELVPVGIKKHRDDAVGFARFLVREVADPQWLSDLARLEAAGLMAYDPARRWSSVRLRYHPRDLVRAAIEPAIEPKLRPSLVVWLRIGARGRLRRLVLSRPW